MDLPRASVKETANELLYDIFDKTPFTDQCAIEMLRSTLAFLFYFFCISETYFYKQFQVLRLEGAALAIGGTFFFIIFSAFSALCGQLCADGGATLGAGDCRGGEST